MFIFYINLFFTKIFLFYTNFFTPKNLFFFTSLGRKNIIFKKGNFWMFIVKSFPFCIFSENDFLFLDCLLFLRGPTCDIHDSRNSLLFSCYLFAAENSAENFFCGKQFFCYPNPPKSYNTILTIQLCLIRVIFNTTTQFLMARWSPRQIAYKE